MADSYKGESLGKKIGRAWFWLLVRQWLGAEFYSGLHLVLASREGGDVAVLKALGVTPSNIVAMEMNARAAERFSEKHPDVMLRVGDVASLVNDKRLRGNLSSAHLDFCSWCSDSVINCAVRVARFGMRNNGVLSVGVMKGREQGYARDVLTYLRRDQEEDGFMKPYQKRWDAADRRAWGRGESSATRQWLLYTRINDQLLSGGPAVGVMPIGSVGYHSGKTPMLYSIFAVRRELTTKRLCAQMGRALEESADLILEHAYELASHEREHGTATHLDEHRSADEFLRAHPMVLTGGRERVTHGSEFGEPSPTMACTMADVIGRMAPGADVPGVLNVRGGRLAAWRAHATRGTYAKGAA